MLASFSLMILPLQYLTAATLASRVKGRTDEEIRAFTGCYEEFTEDQLDEAEEDTLQVYWEETGNRFDPSETKVKPTDRWRLAESERLDREEEEINKKRAKLANYKRRKVN